MIPKGSTVFVNLLQAGLYHSTGKRVCPGQSFAKYFKDSFFECLSHLEFKVKDRAIASDREALSGNPDVPVSSERYQICWRLKRDYLQSKMSFHHYNNTRFYDVLEANEDVVLRNQIVRSLVHKINKMMIQKQLGAEKLLIAAPEVRGLSVAGMVADQLGISLITIRKQGNYKMQPENVVTASYSKGYGQTDTIELPKQKEKLIQGKHVIILDDGIASGGSAVACCNLVNQLKGTVVLILAMVNHEYAQKKSSLSNYKVKTLFDFKKPEEIEVTNQLGIA